MRSPPAAQLPAHGVAVEPGQQDVEHDRRVAALAWRCHSPSGPVWARSTSNPSARSPRATPRRGAPRPRSPATASAECDGSAAGQRRHALLSRLSGALSVHSASASAHRRRRHEDATERALIVAADRTDRDRSARVAAAAAVRRRRRRRPVADIASLGTAADARTAPTDGTTSADGARRDPEEAMLGVHRVHARPRRRHARSAGEPAGDRRRAARRRRDRPSTATPTSADVPGRPQTACEPLMDNVPRARSTIDPERQAEMREQMLEFAAVHARPRHRHARPDVRRRTAACQIGTGPRRRGTTRATTTTFEAASRGVRARACDGPIGRPPADRRAAPVRRRAAAGRLTCAAADHRRCRRARRRRGDHRRRGARGGAGRRRRCDRRPTPRRRQHGRRRAARPRAHARSSTARSATATPRPLVLAGERHADRACRRSATSSPPGTPSLEVDGRPVVARCRPDADVADARSRRRRRQGRPAARSTRSPRSATPTPTT